VGALVIVRPGLSGAGPAALLPLGAGLGFAAYLLLTRRLAGVSPPLVTQAATAAVGATLTSLLLPFLGWSAPGPAEWGLMLAIGCASCVGHVLITVAHGHAPAATLAPLTYLSLVSATALGYLVFGDLPDAPTWLGAAIVVASGLAVWWHGRRP
jgi:drug/metabolite transporter (DMT)-like permease